MKLKTCVFLVGVYFLQYVASHPATKVQLSLPNRTDDPQNFLTSENTKKNVSTIDDQNNEIDDDPHLAVQSLVNESQTRNKAGHDAFVKENVPAEGNSAAQNRQARDDFHNLSVLEFIEKFNASKIQDQNEIDRYREIQRHMEAYDYVEGEEAAPSKDFTNVIPDDIQISLEIRNQLEKEFLERYQQSKGQWSLLASCTGDQRIELCKDAYRRIRDSGNKKVFHAEQEVLPMKVLISKSEPLTTELMKCTVSWPAVRWNGLVFPATKVFYLGEGSSPTEVLKLTSVRNNDEVYIGGKITNIKYPQNF